MLWNLPFPALFHKNHPMEEDKKTPGKVIILGVSLD